MFKKHWAQPCKSIHVRILGLIKNDLLSKSKNQQVTSLRDFVFTITCGKRLIFWGV